MFRRSEDFTNAWAYETEATLKVFRALTDASLAQTVAPGGRTLGRIAWHITGTLAEMGGHAGLPAIEGPRESEPQPSAEEMARLYEAAAASVAKAVTANWTDEMLTGKIPMYGQEWTRGATLAALIGHQAHHRGQMTVLMRQAGLKVPGVYGPAAEEWAAMNMPAQP